MPRGVETDGLEAPQIQLLRIARVWLENHLILVVHLHAVGIFAIATVIRAKGGLDIGYLPRLWPQHTQNSGRIHRPSADFLAIGCPKQTSLFGPIFMEPHYHI